MSRINDGGPAFPPTIRHTERDGVEFFNGMSLRDWFAGMAMQGMYANDTDNWSYEGVATAAYHTADAMLAAREVSNARQ